MQTEKKTFTKAETEIVVFDINEDIITQSTGYIGGEGFTMGEDN